MGLTCPNCAKELQTKQLCSVEVDFCEYGCKGIWFDDNELKKIRQNVNCIDLFADVKGSFVPKDKAASINEAHRICPRCNIEMYRYNWDMQSDIFLDACEQCNGVWLDEGELDGMREYLDKMAQRPVPNQEEMELKMAEIQHETAKKLEQNRIDNVNSVIDWDLGKLDDILRFLVLKITQ